MTGTSLGMIVAKKAKGYTFKDVPMMIAKSAFATISGALLNSLGSCSPKNIISGFI